MLLKCVSKWFLGRYSIAALSRWSALEKAFNTRPSTVPEVSQTVGLFGNALLKSADGFRVAAEECTHRVHILVEEALRQPRDRNIVAIFDELSDCLCQVADLAEFVRFAHPALEYSRSAERASLTVSGLVEQLNTNLPLYEALVKAVRHHNNHHLTDRLTDLDRIVGELFLFDFEQCGIHLECDRREQIVHLNDVILQVGQEFVNGVHQPKIVPSTSIPMGIRNAFPSDGNSFIVTGLHADCPNAETREVAYRLYLSPDDSQDTLLRELLEARTQLAHLCGFQSYAERALRASILETPEKVKELLNRIRDGIRTSADADYQEMSRMKRGNCGPLAVWDVPYLTHLTKRDIFGIHPKEYSPYFSLGACMEGLNMIFMALYGISLDSEAMASGEVWSKDVYKLSVNHESEGRLGYIYCDFYERDEKPNQDCHFTIRGGRQLEMANCIDSEGGYQLPVVVLVLNLALPRWSSPTLLTPSMVDNLFHEMGHAMHSMLARTKYQHTSGTRCSTDLAEVPSMLMEYYSSDPRILSCFARHFQTQEPLPEHMLERLCTSKRVFRASETQLQLFYAALDYAYHSSSTATTQSSTTEIVAETHARYYSLPYVVGTAWQLRFSHLVGYGARYYSYLVSHAISHLIWKHYFVVDPLNRQQGEKYRRECLAFGGGKPPKTLINDYLQVECTPELLADSIVDEIDTNQRLVKRMLNNLIMN